MVVSRQDAKVELLWRRFQRDVIWAAENGWHIEHPKGARKFDLREPQREALERWADGENSITLKARQIGWSTVVGFYACWLALCNPECKILFLSKGEREAQLLLQKVFFGLDRLPSWVAKKAPKVHRRNMTTITFSNGSQILSLPSRNNPARGFTGRLVVVDEWAFLENGDEAWASIEPVTDIGGQVIGLSTANGVGNTFHDLWLRAASGSSSFKPMFFSWRAVPERDEDWYEQKKRDMQVWQLHQEYPDNPEEAFIKSGAMVFDPEVLDYIRDHLLRPPAYRGRLHVQLGDYNFRNDEYGPLSIWEMPEKEAVYAIGADVAEGLEHGDYSSAHVIKVEKNDEGHWSDYRVVAHWHGHIEPDRFAEVLHELGMFYNHALIGCEANNHGLTVNTDLAKRLGYSRLYRERRQDHRRKDRTQRLGWWTDKKSKPILIDDLIRSLREGLGLPDRGTLDELYTFVNDGKGGMNGSPHDDRVISLGIANEMSAFVFAPEYVEEVDDTYTPDWWLRQRDDEGEPQEWIVGQYEQVRSGLW